MMLDNKGVLHLSATDLAGHLSCNHLTRLDAEVAKGSRTKPRSWDPILEILRKRGDLHERTYLDRLEGAGYEIVRIEGVDLEEKQADETAAGVPPKLIIFNGFLVGAGAQHCQGQIRQRDRFATTMTIPTRNGDFGVTRAGSEWPARRAHSTACPNA